MGQRRVTVREAARRLGVTEQAVRKRVKRGTLEADTEAGRVYVYLDASYTGYEPGQDTVTNHGSPASDQLVAEKQARIDSLERQLEEANTRDRENRRIIMQQAQNLAAIEAPEESVSPATQREESWETRAEPQSMDARERVPWWRKLFGR
jgi:predicted transcriptional regulator